MTYNPRRTEQQWRELLQQAEDSQLTTREFCQQNKISTSSFYSKRLRLMGPQAPLSSGFIRAEVTEHKREYQLTNIAVSNMTLRLGDAVLTLPPTTSPQYLAELLGALRS